MLKDIWNKVWKNHWYSSDKLRIRRAKQKISVLHDHLSQMSPNSDICDIGCGSGHFLNTLLSEFALVGSVRGIDHSETAIRDAKGLFEPTNRAAFSVASASDIPFENASFDAVFLVCVLEHIESLDHPIAEIERILKPGGQLFLYYSNRHSFFFLERLIKSLFIKWHFGYQKEASLREIHELFGSNYSIKCSRIVHGDKDFPISTSADKILNFFGLKQFGRYYAIVLKKDVE